MPPQDTVSGDDEEYSPAEEFAHEYKVRISAGEVSRSVSSMGSRGIGLQRQSSSSSSDHNIASEEPVDQWIISVKDEQFPPNHEWLRYFETNPEEPFAKSYHAGIPLPEVDPSAPRIRIAIQFLKGRNKHSVAHAEISNLSYDEADQKTPQWRVFTAATMLRTFDVGAGLSITRRDNSRKYLQEFENGMKRGSYRSLLQIKQTSPRPIAKTPDEEGSQAIIQYNVQDHTFTIDSSDVRLINWTDSTAQDFDIVCTLVEIDMFSLRDFSRNYLAIIRIGQRNGAAKDVFQILATMVNDVRRLWTRSPRLFRMGTRSAIAQSKMTLYGVDYSSNFVTLTSSEAVRKILEQSSSCYWLLDGQKTAHGYIRPQFLQMVIVLVSFLNNDDLGKIENLLENLFQIPSHRPNLELLIMKVLPLASTNSTVFLKDLSDTYRFPASNPGGNEERQDQEIWKDVLVDFAH
jgi:hypothetical protein